jgi:iron(III) transport system substrate-binding protein
MSRNHGIHGIPRKKTKRKRESQTAQQHRPALSLPFCLSVFFRLFSSFFCVFRVFRGFYSSLIPFLVLGCSGNQPRVVLYCAQDHVFARGVLEEFRNDTGIRVDPKFDTEAAKSVSLYTEIVKEKDRPRCDVFWNNEIINTIRLQRQGLLEAYESPAAEPYPGWAKAKDHTWHAFAGRARVLLVNTEKIPDPDHWPRRLFDLVDGQWKSRVVIAKPNHGTSATHAACLFSFLGSEKARQFYQGLKDNDVQIAPGNKQVAEWVGQGKTPRGQIVAIGLTDTDDAIAEVEAGRKVAIVFPDRDREGMGTLFIPNTVAILRNSPNPERARQLVDYLLSPEIEKRLAETESHQIPLNPEVKAKLPEAIKRPSRPGSISDGSSVKAMPVDFAKATDCWEEAQQFLKEHFTGP